MSSDNTNVDSADPDVRKVTAGSRKPAHAKGEHYRAGYWSLKTARRKPSNCSSNWRPRDTVEVAVDGQKGFDRVRAADFALVISDI